MNGRLVAWLLVISATRAALALPSRVDESPPQQDENSKVQTTTTAIISTTTTTSPSTPSTSPSSNNQLAVRGARKLRYWIEPFKGLKLDFENNNLLVKYSPYKNAVESRTGELGLGGGGGDGGEEGGGGGGKGKGKKGKGGKKEKGKKKDKPTMMQRIGTFMMMIPVTMQLMQLPMAIASVKMSLLRSILVGKVALLILIIRTLLTSQPQEKIVVVRAPPKEVHEHFYHPFEDPDDNKPGWLGGGGGKGSGGHGSKDHGHGRDYTGNKEFGNGEVYEHINACEAQPEDESNVIKSTESPVYKKPSAQEAVEALDLYTKWLESEMGAGTEDKTNLENYRNKAVDKL